MRLFRRLFLAGVIAALFVSGPLLAGPLQDGITAYKKGEHQAAARHWYSSAQQGNPWAQLLLGILHDHGIGVPASRLHADYLYELAVTGTAVSGLTQEQIRKGMRRKFDLDPYEQRDPPPKPFNPLDDDDDRGGGLIDGAIDLYNKSPIKPDIQDGRKGFKVEIPFSLPREN